MASGSSRGARWRRPPPALIDDLIIEILLRLPPDDIACLARASLVCRTWRRLLSDRVFSSLYHKIHGAPPLIGFLYNIYGVAECSPSLCHYIARCSPLFVQTTPTSTFSQRPSSSSLAGCKIIDCRHGRVLLHHPGCTSPCLVIWDPVTGLQRCISAPASPLTAAVLCASNGCIHHGCSYGPYLVVLLAQTQNDRLGMGVPRAQAQASLYSSETGKWSVSEAIDLCSLPRVKTPSLLARDTLFFHVERWHVLKYDLTSGVLSGVCMPIHPTENMILCTADDGGLGVAAVEGCTLRLVFSRANPDGDIGWWQVRVFELDSMIPSSIGDRFTQFYVAGFAEGTGYIFIRANDNIFSVELKSGRFRKIGSGMVGGIFPFMGFFIPGLSSDRLQLPARFH